MFSGRRYESGEVIFIGIEKDARLVTQCEFVVIGATGLDIVCCTVNCTKLLVCRGDECLRIWSCQNLASNSRQPRSIIDSEFELSSRIDNQSSNNA